MDDVLQEARVALWKAANTYQSDRGVSFGSYASTVIRNRLRSLYDAGKRQPQTTSLDVPTMDAATDTRTDNVPSPIVRMASESDREVVTAAVAKLPEKPRRILERWLAGDDWRTIGTQEAMSHEGARRIATAAMNTLRADLRKAGVQSVEDVFPTREEFAANLPPQRLVQSREDGLADLDTLPRDEAPEATDAGVPVFAAPCAPGALEAEVQRHLDAISTGVQNMRQARAANSNVPSMRGELWQAYQTLFRGRLDRADAMAPGIKQLLLDAKREEQLAQVAVNALSDRLRTSIQDAFGDPAF